MPSLNPLFHENQLSKTSKSYEFKPDYFREIYPDRIHIMSEGILNFYSFVRGRWDREQAAWRVSAKYWNLINQRPWFCGGAMWCFTDYGQNGVLDLHGAVDRYRLRKETFYFYEAMWADHSVLHIIGHWNHEAGYPREIVVFTNCRDVELTLNGKSVGRGISCADEYPSIKNAPLVWKDVTFKEGTLEVTGKFGTRKIVDRRKTAGKPAQVVLAASNDQLIANGRDISFVDLTICDADGNCCYTTDGKLSLTVSGTACLGGPKEIAVTAGLDRKYAHKISFVWKPASETYYMFYNAVGNKGRGIGLITSKPLVRQQQNKRDAVAGKSAAGSANPIN